LFDMHIAENIGFEKFDILSQRHWSYRWHSKISSKKIDWSQYSRYNIIKKWNKVQWFLSTGKTIGCFISKVLPCVDYCDGLNDNYKILVAASSIIRPVWRKVVWWRSIF
jgi:DNA polymerase-3 subunit alpha/error-prone DNA polymerase